MCEGQDKDRLPSGRKPLWRRAGLALPLLAVLWSVAPHGLLAQTQTPTQPPAQSGTSGQAGSGPGAQGAPQAKPQEPQEEAEHHISKKEAKDLFLSVDEIMAFASKDTGLPVRHSVKRKLTSRDQVADFIKKRMAEDKDAQRLQRSELVLKKFGLLPRDFDLSKFLVALLREQVAGYYDPKTRTINLLDWIDEEQQKPVMAHELTHALQDQWIGLEKWMEAGDIDLDKIKEPTPADIQGDEVSEARQAVVEGQAMVVLVDYMLAPLGKTLQNSPDMVEALKAGMLVGTADSVEFHNAPIFLKESLTFPYRYGIDFVAAVLTREGKEKAFASVLEHPPVTTRQIMEPETYLDNEKIDPLPLPDFARDLKSYERFDIGAIGEFDVAVMVDQYAGVDAAKRVYPHWGGGITTRQSLRAMHLRRWHWSMFRDGRMLLRHRSSPASTNNRWRSDTSGHIGFRKMLQRRARGLAAPTRGSRKTVRW
jgi:hypothetical protein